MYYEIKVLENHGIKWRRQDGELQVLDEAMHNGEYIAVWVKCPESPAELYRWLGY